MNDLIERQAAIVALSDGALVNYQAAGHNNGLVKAIDVIKGLPSAQPYTEDYAELKREFIRMAEYVDMFLKCSDEQKETLIGFISRLAEFMPWTERD